MSGGTRCNLTHDADARGIVAAFGRQGRNAGEFHWLHQVSLDSRGNIVVQDFMASEEGIFAAGDTQLGASLVVRAISTGRQAAASIDRWLLSR